MKITILYDNTSFVPELESDWGFSALVETGGQTILFDTGANGRILMGNIEKLNINLLNINNIFISHHHYDHVGGLSEFLNEHNDVTLFSPESFRGVKNVKENIYIKEQQELYPNIYTTGQLDDIEQSLIVKTNKGVVVIVGCAHPGLDKIAKVAEEYGRVYAIIGGFHGFRRFIDLKKVDYFCPAHCSKFACKIKEKFPYKYIDAGVGRIIEI